VAARDRIEVPRADRPLAVPGLGLCLPERLADGWLVRPHDATATIRARLDGVRLEVEADGGSWRAELTPRHAEVLRHLAAAGPAGLTAAALSTRLFGDDAHLVTVRAEVSRLRRVVGALLATNPYRLADGVELIPR
jgi:DNA-binding response OmpR family regulator